MKIKPGLLVLLILLTAPLNAQRSASALAQSSTGSGQKADLAQMPLENVRLEVQSIEEFFSRLSFSYDIPVGLEVALNESPFDVYRLDFKKGSLSDLLTQFVTEHDQYAWKIESGVVSVFPKDDFRDPVLRELLATELSSFAVKEKTTCWSFGDSLVSTPEIKRILKLYGITYDAGYLGGFYLQQLGQRFSFDVSKMRLKSILDKVVRESPVARIWSIKNNRSAQTLSLRVKAGPEYVPQAPAIR
jgi:hypothetical protein